jgi:hypothetical protein
MILDLFYKLPNNDAKDYLSSLGTVSLSSSAFPKTVDKEV